MRAPGTGWRRIAVLGNYGNRNLGDEATLGSVVQFVRQRCPGAVVCALSEHPAETRRRHAIEAVPSALDARTGDPDEGPPPPARPSQGAGTGLRGGLKARLKRLPVLFTALRAAVRALRAVPEAARYLRFSARSFLFLRRVDLLVVAGGGQLSDHFEGVWGFPLQLYSWCLLARLAGARVAVLNVGAGPIGGPGSRLLFRWTLRLADHRSYRDERSRRLVQDIGVRNPGPVGPDLVFGWEPPAAPAPEPGDCARRTVGVNVFPYRDWRYWPMYDPAAYAHYIDRIADLTRSLLDRGYRVRLFPTHLRADVRVIADVLERLQGRPGAELPARLEVASIATVDDLANEVRRSDLVIATRFHAIVLAMLLGRPVLGLCNESKMRDLMAEMGQAAYSLSLDTFDVRTAIARLLELEANRDHVAVELAARVERARQTLDAQLQALFGPRIGSLAAATAPAADPAQPVAVAQLDVPTGRKSW